MAQLSSRAIQPNPSNQLLRHSQPQTPCSRALLKYTMNDAKMATTFSLLCDRGHIPQNRSTGCYKSNRIISLREMEIFFMDSNFFKSLEITSRDEFRSSAISW